MLGRISTVGVIAWVGTRVLVAVGGNQTIVGVMVSNGGGDVGGMRVGMGVEMLRQALNIYIVTLSAR